MSTTILLGLEQYLEDVGWDQPSRLINIQGIEIAPTFSHLTDLTGHPCDLLPQMWDDGVRVPADAMGMALVAEGFRHVTVAELERRSPEMYALMLEGAIDAQPDAEIETAVQNAWAATTAVLPAPQMPEDLRIPVRNSIAVLSSRWTIRVVRDRGGDPQTLSPVPPAQLIESRVPDFMWQFLTGQRPTD